MSYAASAWESGVDLGSCRTSVSSLPAFFRTGTLYYKPYAVLLKTFNPFRDLLERLSDEETRRLSAFQSDFADPEAAIGSFNLDRVFRLTRGLEVAGPDANGRKVRFKRFAVETCYGYWVPETLAEEAVDVLSQAAKGRRALLETWRDWLTEEQDAIVAAYRQYLADAKRTLEEQDIEWRKYVSPALFKKTKRIKGHLERLAAELGDEDRLRRHCDAYVPSAVPEIWEDVEAREDFEDSFFESLEIASGSRQWPKATGLLLRAMGVYSRRPMAAAKIRERLERSLRDDGWYEDSLGVPLHRP